MKAFKGFNKNLTCRDFQYKEGETYKHDGEIVRCTNQGFHSCQFPLDVFNYYNPADSVFHEVILSGEIDKANDDTKVCSAEITINAELHLPQFISRAVDWIMSQVSDSDTSVCNEEKSHASNTGYQSAASNTGDYSAASVEGESSVAMACGYNSKAKACIGSAIVLCYRNNDYEIVHIKAALIDGEKLKANTWYKLNESGEFVEFER